MVLEQLDIYRLKKRSDVSIIANKDSPWFLPLKLQVGQLIQTGFPAQQTHLRSVH